MRVAFFFSYPWLDTLPFMREPIYRLAKKGIECHVFMPASNCFPSPKVTVQTPPRILSPSDEQSTTYEESGAKMGGGSERLPPKFDLPNIRIIPFEFSSRMYIRPLSIMAFNFIKYRYSLYCCTPVDAAILGALIAKLTRRRLIIFSDEIEPIRNQTRRRLMGWAYRIFSLIVITDLKRIQLLNDMGVTNDSKKYWSCRIVRQAI